MSENEKDLELTQTEEVAEAEVLEPEVAEAEAQEAEVEGQEVEVAEAEAETQEAEAEKKEAEAPESEPDDVAEKAETEKAEASEGKKGKKEKKPFRSRPHWKATLVIIIAVVVVAIAGFTVWHNTPSFCDAICHNPQDPYNPTYDAEPGQAAVDKWGNEVENASGMLAATHRAYGSLVCIDCHEPIVTQQIAEGFNWLIGNYYNPLSERSIENLMSYQKKKTGEEFCMNESCHNLSKADLTEATSVYARNPHAWHHFEYTCSDCHKSHRASIMVCTECHDDAVTPEGWLTVEESRQLETIYGAFDLED